jgi:lysophospholipase L1-like esterase
MTIQGARLSSRLVQRFVRIVFIPACIVAVGVVITTSSPTKYTLAYYELLAFAAAICFAAVVGGKIRNAATSIASLALGLSCIELFSASMLPDRPVTSKGFSTSQPILGWGPSGPGTYRARKVGNDGKVIYDIDYTIDAAGLRRTLSAPSGRTIAFFGDSFTFGEGVRDEDTLPQAFADIGRRRLHVLNFGFPGYGPQQFLREIETGLYDNLLTNAAVFVFQTSAWHAERSSCLADFVIRAPRYELRAGEPVYTGPCGVGLVRAFKEFRGNMATFRRFIEPALLSIGPRDLDLYIAEISRAAKFAEEKYGVPTIVLYVPAGDAYLAKAGTNDAEIEARFREAGLLVLDGTLSRADFEPGTMLERLGDGHPTAAAHRARARLLHEFLTKDLPNAIDPIASN